MLAPKWQVSVWSGRFCGASAGSEPAQPTRGDKHEKAPAIQAAHKNGHGRRARPLGLSPFVHVPPPFRIESVASGKRRASLGQLRQRGEIRRLASALQLTVGPRKALGAQVNPISRLTTKVVAAREATTDSIWPQRPPDPPRRLKLWRNFSRGQTGDCRARLAPPAESLARPLLSFNQVRPRCRARRRYFGAPLSSFALRGGRWRWRWAAIIRNGSWSLRLAASRDNGAREAGRASLPP